MKKRDLVKAVKKGFPSSEKMINLLFRAINEALIKGDKVTIYNFGEFYVAKLQYKHFYDFQKKKMVSAGQKYRVKFRPSPTVDRIINERMNDAGSKND